MTHMTPETFRRITRAAGYSPRIEFYRDNVKHIAFYCATAYDTKRGVGVCRESWGARRPDTFEVCVRKNGYYDRVPGKSFKTLSKAIKYAATLTGDPPKKRVKNCAVWRKPNKVHGGVIKGKVFTRGVRIVEAEAMGVCHIEANNRVTLSPSNPDVSDVYFCVRVKDIRRREFFVILKDKTQFLVALKRGATKNYEPVIYPVMTDWLFKSGGNPLDLRTIDNGDIKFVLESCEGYKWT